jgi:hypothetical protein
MGKTKPDGLRQGNGRGKEQLAKGLDADQRHKTANEIFLGVRGRSDFRKDETKTDQDSDDKTN